MVKQLIKSSNWKQVEVNREFLDNEDFSDLLGIEECTDYELLGSKSLKQKRKNKTQQANAKKKRKLSKDKSKKEIKLEPDLSPSKQGSTEADPENVELEITEWDKFGLPKPLLLALQAQQFKEPTRIQALTLPAAILGRRDILGAAETGSGKTLAFGLPILAGILQDQKINKEAEKKLLYALILTPTRELAMQVSDHLKAAAKFTEIKVATIVGGMAAVKQERILAKGPEIVVATPGRLWELIQQGNPHLSKIDSIKFLAIDETDRMLERGHFEELHNLIERLNEAEENKLKRQNFVFSATLTLVHELPKYITTKLKRRKTKEMKPEEKLRKIIDLLGITKPKIVDVTSEGGGTSSTLTECRITCSINEKDYYVYYFLQKHPGRTLIFCNSIGCVKRLTNLLGVLNCKPLPLHASMQQRQRLKNLDRFRQNKNSILIATDVAARGLDIAAIEHVLHYQTPRTSENYVHRSGRTARASKEGITVLIMEPSELPNYVKLCRTLNKTEDLPLFPVQDNYLNAVKERVNLARELDKLDLEIRRTNSESGWLEKAAKEMDIEIDEFTKKYDTEDAVNYKKAAEFKRKKLARLLATPIFPKGFSGKYPLSTGALYSEAPAGTAVEIMKIALEKSSKDKKRAIPLYKPKKDKVKPRNLDLTALKQSKNKFKNRKNRK